MADIVDIDSILATIELKIRQIEQVKEKISTPLPFPISEDLQGKGIPEVREITPPPNDKFTQSIESIEENKKSIQTISEQLAALQGDPQRVIEQEKIDKAKAALISLGFEVDPDYGNLFIQFNRGIWNYHIKFGFSIRDDSPVCSKNGKFWFWAISSGYKRDERKEATENAETEDDRLYKSHGIERLKPKLDRYNHTSTRHGREKEFEAALDEMRRILKDNADE